MKKALGLLSLFALLSTAAYADCIRPPKPASLPAGNTASRDAMVAANRVVKQYTADMKVYIECNDTEFLEYRVRELANTPYAKFLNGAAVTTQQAIVSHVLCNGECEKMATAHRLRNNAAVDEMEGVVKQFNEQLRLFKSRNPQ